jgi:hypothetical protein
VPNNSAKNLMAVPSVKNSWARVTGSVYLSYFLSAIAGQALVSKGLTLTGQVVNIISVSLYISLGILLYRLFRSVGRFLSLVATLFDFAGSSMTLVTIFHGGRAPLSPLLFFGANCSLIGILILRSDFLPHALGLL